MGDLITPRPLEKMLESFKREKDLWAQLDRFIAANKSKIWDDGSLKDYLVKCVAEREFQPYLTEIENSTLVYYVASRIYIINLWRFGKGIYRFDPTLFDELTRTSKDTEINWEIFYRLPELCLYVETPRIHFEGERVYGFYLNVQRFNYGNNALFIAIDSSKGFDLIPFYISWKSTIEENFELTMSHENKNFPEELQHTGGAFRKNPDDAATLIKCIHLALYLCSEEPDIARRPGGPKPNAGKKLKKSQAPMEPAFWDVGFRIGAAIQKAREEIVATGNGGGSGASKTPHLRRAHWHSYWTGPRSGDRKLVLKWVMPALVGTQWSAYLPAIVHPVKE